MNEIKNKKILVTGGAGFIGSHLVDALMVAGCHVRVIDNLVNGKRENIAQHFRDPKFEFVLGDVVDSRDVAKVMKNVDIVFHLACLGVRHSISYPLENHKVNALGTLVVLKSALREKVRRFVHCSSSEVYGTAMTVPMKENHPTYPCTVYGASKLAGEAYARAYYLTYGLNITILRLFNTYGPRSHHEDYSGELIPRSIVRALCNKSIVVFGDGSQTRDFTYVTDSVKGLLLAAKSDEAIGNTYNIGSGSEISINEVVRLIIREIGNPKVKVKHLKSRPGDVLRLYANSSIFKKLAGWKPKVSFREGIFETIAWFRAHAFDPYTLLKQSKEVNWK